MDRMKYLKIILPLIVVSILFGCKKEQKSIEQAEGVKWFKGNLHTHSYWSDGDDFPEEIMNWYKSNGYQFVALSDHNILAKGDKWIEIKEDSIYQDAFRAYLKDYGSDWVVHKMDSGKIHVKLKTLEEYKSKFEEEEKFLIIQSEEISDEFEGKPLHMVGTNLETLIEPQGGNSVVEVLQNNIDAVYQQREETGTPMIPHINHPNYKYAISLEDLIAIKRDRFFEVYNGHPMVHNLGDSIHMSTENMWDQINIAYLANNQELMYGLATDDSHQYHRIGGKFSNAGRGWIMVQTDSLKVSSLINAMESGAFYASTGVTLESIVFEKNTLSIEVQPENGLTYKIDFIGARKDHDESEIFKSDKGNKASFKLSDDILFVRCKITSSKNHNNPIEDLLYEMAWTQPVTRIK